MAPDSPERPIADDKEHGGSLTRSSIDTIRAPSNLPETKKNDGAATQPDAIAAESPADEESSPAKPSIYDNSRIRRLLTPKKLRWDDNNPRVLKLPLCLLYAFSTTFTVANLYYVQPIFTNIAHDFGVTYEESSHVATLLQSGYAAGLIFLLPLGDMLERRPFIIGLIIITATLWIILCLTTSFVVFQTISFICGVTTVTPQLMIPLVGDFAPPGRSSAWLSFVVSGLLLGMLIARLLSGVVANFVGWRAIYWFSVGAQYLLGALLFAFMPDYPSKNPQGLSYFRAMWSIPQMMISEPALWQPSLTAFTLSAIFTSFWTTLDFLLSGSPYHYSTLDIGLFALLGIVAMISVPLYARFMDPFVPLFSTFISQLTVLVGVIIGTFTGTFSVAGPVIQAVAIDLGMQTAQVSNRAAIFTINPKARNRVNTAYMAFAFAGQLTGTAVGNRLYAQGGWYWSSGCSLGIAVLSLAITFCRGPREERWVGWRGSWRPRKDKAPPEAEQSAEVGLTREKVADSTSSSNQ